MAIVSTTETRRAFIKAKIAAEGGAYITPEQNRQPDPALRIASIRCGEIIALGSTEEMAQVNFLRQAYAAAPGPVRVAP